jgi:hypothetical protein
MHVGGVSGACVSIPLVLLNRLARPIANYSRRRNLASKYFSGLRVALHGSRSKLAFQIDMGIGSGGVLTP